MSNNIVFLVGWLEIENVQTVTLGRDQSTPTTLIHAWVYTDKPYLGGKHPIVFTGEPAQTAMEWAREWPPHTPLPQVVVQGQLVTHNGQSRVNVRKVSFLGSFDPAYKTMMIGLARLLEKKQDGELRSGLADLLHRNARGSDYLGGANR
ncbi:MAG: hypothetical protein ACKOC5_04825 [Chloroflexota bacterium]